MSVVLDNESTLLHQGFVALESITVAADQLSRRLENIAEEVAVALEYNGIAHAVMMASPLDLEDFALGFSLSEGIVSRASEIKNIELSAAVQGINVHITIAEPAFQALKQRRRQLTGRTGCGLCGYESLESAIRPIRVITRDIHVSLAQVQAGLQHLQQQQTLNQATGAVHAAALVSIGGVLVREDVGRHNALDKLIGAMVAQSQYEGFVVMTSRASYEIVHKAAAANIPLLATISAPTDLAIRLAEEAGLTLIGFARDQRMTVYSHPQRVIAGLE
jgi:formate dehydrogenase accessory protein FdhD